TAGRVVEDASRYRWNEVSAVRVGNDVERSQPALLHRRDDVVVLKEVDDGGVFREAIGNRWIVAARDRAERVEHDPSMPAGQRLDSERRFEDCAVSAGSRSDEGNNRFFQRSGRYFRLRERANGHTSAQQGKNASLHSGPPCESLAFKKTTRSKEPRPDCVTQEMRLIAASFRT